MARYSIYLSGTAAVCNVGSMKRSSAGNPTANPTLHKVFASCLSPKNTWYALNSTLCCTKPCTFCSSATAKLFPAHYQHVNFDDLYGENGSPASFKWFCSHRRSEKVYVATPFGLLLGILRLKNFEECPFIQTEAFKTAVEEFSFNSSHSTTKNLMEEHWKSHSKTMETALSSAAKEIVALRAQLQVQLPNTPPSTPSPPKLPRQSPPNFDDPSPPKPKARKPTILGLKRDQEISASDKKRRIKEIAVAHIKKLNGLCESSGETLGTILGECSILAREEDRHGVHGAIATAFDIMAQEKGAKKAFAKLVSEEVWDKRLQCMRAPDWLYLLFKLKSRMSDSSWQDLTNLTRLGRTGVSNRSDYCLL